MTDILSNSTEFNSSSTPALNDLSFKKKKLDQNIQNEKLLQNEETCSMEKLKIDSKIGTSIKTLSSSETLLGADSLFDSSNSKDSFLTDTIGDATSTSSNDESSLSPIKQCVEHQRTPKSRAPSPPDSYDSPRKRSSSFTQETNVKSTAVLKYNQPTSFHFKFLQLSYNTNLKKPPENWLRMRSGSFGPGAGQSHYSGRFGSYFWSYPFSKSTSWSMFSSFRVANQFPDCVGELDVISDAKNIKTLLKIPFSESHVSMMVHRIEKTLLLDDFDVSSQLLRAEEKQWEWLRQFICKYITNAKDRGPLVPRKGTSRDSIKSSSMLNKFLHYSILNSDSTIEEERFDSNSVSKEENKSSIPDSMTLSSNQNRFESSWSLDFSFENVDGQLDTIEQTYSNTYYSKEYLRNLLWTFEDIHMLVGSDMPIFGDAKHPAVSLKLIDVQKPIKILTGLDYWLDNLMCSVPEVVMCYHLDGIVQKYELIKTEEIPLLKNSQFSPKVIRDIAQNILTFLKTKATKSGHTYWLFKGRHDDVVKLYDLTSLCSEYVTEESNNPYALPVAMLLYRVAKNLKDSNTHSKSTVYRLLSNCLNLLDLKKYLQIAISGRYQMADLLIPDGINLSSPKKSSENMEEDDEDEFFDTPENSTTEGEEESSDEVYSEISVSKLSTDSSINEKKSRTKTSSPKQKKSSKDIFKKDWLTRCKESLQMLKANVEQIIEEYLKEKDSAHKPKESKSHEDTLSTALSSEPISMNPKSLVGESNDCKRQLIPQSNQSKNQTEIVLACQLIGNVLKAAHVYSVLAELKTNEKQFIDSFLTIKMGMKCNQVAQQMLSKNGKEKCPQENLSCLLGLTGDNHLLSCGLSNVVTNTSEVIYEKEFYNLFKKLDVDCDIAEYDWCFSNSHNIKSKEDKLHLAVQCYEAALALRPCQNLDKVKKNQSLNEMDALERRLKRKLGNSFNELSAFYMDKVTDMYNGLKTPNDDDIKNTLDWIEKSSLYLGKGVEIFKSVNDVVNCVLLLSNTGKLMRISAHVFVPLNSENKRQEFSSREKQYYNKALHYYETAASMLKGASKKDKNGAKNLGSLVLRINWELSSTLYTMGTLIQDFAPVSNMAWEKIEQNIDSYFNRALKILDSSSFQSNESFSCLQGIRKATIYYRLGSLYHHKLRSMSENDPKRKQTFNLADSYYDKSHEIYIFWEYKVEFLTSLLERIAMHEQILNIYSGFSVKLKANQKIIQLLMLSKNSISLKVEEEEEKKECFNLLKLLFQRLQKAIDNIIQIYTSKASKYREALKSWKRLHLEVSKVTILNNNLDSLEKKILTICDSCLELINQS